MADGNDSISKSHLWGAVGVIVAAVALGLNLHAQFVVPGILLKAGAMMDSKLEAHEKRPHPGAIDTSRWNEVVRRLDAIDERLRELEAKR